MKIEELKNVFVGPTIGLVVTFLRYIYMTAWMNAPWIPPEKPVSKVAVIMPTLNEEAFIAKSLESLNNQNVIQAYPELFDRIVADGGSTDRTVEIAKQYGWRVLNCPQGKLTQIDFAIRNTDADIIVQVDADTWYGPNTLNLMLQHFKDPQVVGVTGGRIYDTLTGKLAAPWVELYFTYFNPRMLGLLSAYRKSAYFRIGGYNLNIDQTDVKQMVDEEEFGLWRKLSSIGKVVKETRANGYTSVRRFFCPIILAECNGECPYHPALIRYCKEIERRERF